MRSWSPDAGQHIFRAYRAFAGFSLAVSSNAIDVQVVPQEEVEAIGCSAVGEQSRQSSKPSGRAVYIYMSSP